MRVHQFVRIVAQRATGAWHLMTQANFCHRYLLHWNYCIYQRSLVAPAYLANCNGITLHNTSCPVGNLQHTSQFIAENRTHLIDCVLSYICAKIIWVVIKPGMEQNGMEPIGARVDF